MHIPDGFINVPTSAGFGAAAAGSLWYSLRRAADYLDDRRIPLAGLVAAFVFAAQMVNFPVAAGTSGHLLGGVLAAVLVGPWLGSTVLTVVLIVQAIVFADGGLSALGLNVFNMAILGALGGYVLYLIAAQAPPEDPGFPLHRSRYRGRTLGAAGRPGFQPPVRHRRGGRSLGHHRDGGHAGSPRSDRHRRGPDHGTGRRSGRRIATRPDPRRTTGGRPMDRRTWAFLAAGLVLAIGIAGFSGLFSSGEPDGLERVSIDQGFDDDASRPGPRFAPVRLRGGGRGQRRSLHRVLPESSAWSSPSA